MTLASRSLASLALFALALAAAPLALKADAPGHLSGTVYDSNGLPIAGATVRAHSQYGDQVRKTDKRGFFTVLNADNGDIAMTVVARGYDVCFNHVDLLSGQAVSVKFITEPLPADLSTWALGHSCVAQFSRAEPYDRYEIR
jgi:hypothetical protein